MPRPPRKETAVSEALTRAGVTEGAKLPRRFTAEPCEPHSQLITDTATGRSAEVMVTCFGTVRRVLSELFPDG